MFGGKNQKRMQQIMCELLNKQCINGSVGGGLLFDQLWYNALQRCFAIWPQPAAVGGPFLTDGRTNLLISPTIAEAEVGGVFGGLYEEPNSST